MTIIFTVNFHISTIVLTFAVKPYICFTVLLYYKNIRLLQPHCFITDVSSRALLETSRITTSPLPRTLYTDLYGSFHIENLNVYTPNKPLYFKGPTNITDGMHRTQPGYP